ncbi:type IV conjugative transfer system coupling protein TraD [Moritella viscosa]|uniref:type IV conjugative transfer system coupling protein TraD n=1 Tax=Moritella viscosa TaxID=80854 RepID=UPI0009162A99|nr:type IV conjugative transfer system coupling protein TraD [Moritella viscosa]SGZ09470.1 Conjugative transfer protein TraD [Moritella viscosa]
MHADKRPKNSNFTRGGQITFHNLHMFFQINTALAKWVAYCVLGVTVLATYITTPVNTFTALWLMVRNNFLLKFNSPLDTKVSSTWEGVTHVGTLGNQLKNQTLIDLSENFWQQIQLNFLFSTFAGIVICVVATRYFKTKGDQQTEDHFIRGILKAEPAAITKVLKRKGKVSSFAIDGHRLFKQDFEVQHLLIDGTTGAGKSVAIRKLITWIRARGDKAVIYDKGCTFVSKFYDPSKDVILNPFDKRCANWNVWCDAKEAPDFESMAAALIPQHGEGDPFWVESARTIFASAAFQMMNDDKESTTARLLHVMLTSELETLGAFLKGTEASALVSDKIEKTAISIKSVLATYIKALRFLEGLDDRNEAGKLLRPEFSIQDWVQDDNQKGFLFLSSNAQQHASLRPLISMWLAIASNAILGLDANPSRRIWVIMDEMPSLHKLPELGSIIAEVRKFGGCYVVGIQSYAQLLKTYGKHAADEMFDLLNTRFYFRAPSSEMAKISSHDLGEQDVDISKENYSYGAHAMRDGVSLGHQTITRPVVSSSEIQTLDDLQCWLRTPQCNLVTRLDLKFDKMKDITPPFIKRDYTMSAEMKTIYSHLAHAEIRALHGVDSKTQKTLIAAQEGNFENQEEQELEANNLKDALHNPVKQEMEAQTRNKKTEEQRKQNEQYDDWQAELNNNLQEKDYEID